MYHSHPINKYTTSLAKTIYLSLFLGMNILNSANANVSIDKGTTVTYGTTFTNTSSAITFTNTGSGTGTLTTN